MKSSNLTNTPSAERPLWKRWTLIGGAIVVLAQWAEAQDLLPYGSYDWLLNGANLFGISLGGLGVYRHIPTT